ncbi:zinc finger, CCHC-type containing protein [Tanacetum coccineum]
MCDRRYEKKLKFVEQPMGHAPPDPETTDPSTIDKTLEKYNAYDMLKELKTMFEEQAKQALFKIVKAFHACKLEDGMSVRSYLLKMKSYLDTLERLGYAMPNELGVSLILNSLKRDYVQTEVRRAVGVLESLGVVRAVVVVGGASIGIWRKRDLVSMSVRSYLLKMKSYLDTLERLGYAMPNELGVSLILNSLNKNYDQFMQNYNMHNMGKTVAELHAMLKLYEKGIPKKVETLAVLAIRRLKIPPPPKRDNPAKDSVCHHCKEVGHCRRNCPSYHADLKERKNVRGASTLGIFTIELYAFPNKS